MAPDGSYLLFISNRPASGAGRPLDGFYDGAARPAAGGNLWRVDRTTHGWGEPHRLPEVVNSNTSIYSPSIASDGSVYFMQPTGAKTRFHLFRSQFSHGAFLPAVEVPVGAGDDVGDFDPAVAPDESFMVFSSTRLPDKGTSLFIAFQKSGVWSTPEYMGDTVSVPRAGNIEARLGSDYRTLYFSSNHVEPASPHQSRAESERGIERMSSWNNGLMNIWRFSLDPWLAR